LPKTNPEPDKPLALKSRGVVEFTAAEGLVTRNKSTSPVFRWSLLRRHPQFH